MRSTRTGPHAFALQSRLLVLPSNIVVGVTIISYEEQSRGWLSFLAQSKGNAAQLNAYHKLFKHLDDWRTVHVLPFDESALKRLDHLRTLKLKIGTSDLKIAAVALSKDALLLSRNLQHFKKVPNLRVEDWTQPSSAMDM